MPLESGQYIPELDDNNPVGTDPVSAGDDHLRLIKRAVTQSFPAFEGTAAVPAFVELTEAQINDAALKGEDQTIAGAWTFNGDATFEGEADLRGITTIGQPAIPSALILEGDATNSSNIQAKTIAGTPVVVFRRAPTADSLQVGASTLSLQMNGSATRPQYNARELAFENPTYVNVGAGRTLTQADAGKVLQFTSGTVTLAALAAGTTICLESDATGFAIAVGSTLLAWRDGSGTVKTGARTIKGNSIVTLYWSSTNGVRIFGNGIS